MNILRFLTIFITLIGFWGCAEVKQVFEKPAPAKTPVSMHAHRSGDVLHLEFAIADSGWDYTSVLSNDGMTYTLVIKDTDRAIGKINYIRPILDVQQKQYPSGFKLVFKLVNKHILSTSKNSSGLSVALTAIEPDVEMLTMRTFGSWADPERPAKQFSGVEYKDGMSQLSFDGTVLYATGEAGGRFFVDIFGMYISQGSVKHKGLAAVNNIDRKTRFIFKNKIDICAEEWMITFGKSCDSYSGLSGFKRLKNEKTESFEFSLPGRPEMKIMEKEHIVAFGFKDTKLFSKVFQRYSDGGVYKVEAREKDGMLWLIFLYNGDLKFRKYYSGDKFFVVFYRGQA